MNAIRWLPLAVLVVAELAGCAFAHVDRKPRKGYAQVDVALQQTGELAVRVWRIESKHRVFSQHLDSPPHSLDIKPGTYTLVLNCWRQGGWTVVDGSPEFPVTVTAGRRYVLDCAPTPDYENHFALTERD